MAIQKGRQIDPFVPTHKTFRKKVRETEIERERERERKMQVTHGHTKRQTN